jgi:N-acetylneuraminic acid mutarotase
VFYNNSIYLIGGNIGENSNSSTLYRYNIPLREWTIYSNDLLETTTRIGFTMCTFNNEIYLFGGDENLTHFPIFYCYSFNMDTKEWKTCSILHQGSPEGRFSHSGVVWKNQYLMFGGDANTLDFSFDEIWSFHFESKEWTDLTLNCIGSIPRERSFHISELDRRNDVLYIFGGIYYTVEGEKHLNDMFCLNMETLMWKEIVNDYKPCVRRSHSSILSRDEKDFFVFGGFGENQFLNDLWSFNFENLEWKEIILSCKYPTPRRYFSISHDIHKNGFFIFGGYTKNEKTENDLWKLDFEVSEVKFQNLIFQNSKYFQDLIIKF